MSHTVTDSADPATLLAGRSLAVAPRLLGAELTMGQVTVRLTEVEAYAGADDPGSHAYRGPTDRNRVMFGRAGLLYVYFTYGMHHCANLVCGPEGTASAVLLRAGEVIAGLDLARARRPGSSDRDLARGPARMCRALALDLSHSGADALAPDGAPGPRLQLRPALPTDRIRTGPRVGLRHAADRPWRFWIDGEPTVSAYRPAKGLRAPDHGASGGATRS